MNLNLDFGAILERWPIFLDGAILTLELAFIATVLGALIGVLGAIGRRSSVTVISRICGIYVETIRNTPLLVQIFLVYFGLASLGLKFSAFTVAAAALTINVGAYTTEIIRAGFDSIPRGQIEAAEGLALSRAQIYWHVVLWPAIERVYPALTSQFVLLMLASSVTSQISAEELTAVANYVQSDTYRAFETYILVAIAYVFLSLLMRGGSGCSDSPCSRAVGASARRCEEIGMGGSLNINHLLFLGQGALWTIGLSLIGLIGGGIFGFIIALCRISPVRMVRILSAGYVQLIQGTPLLVIMFLTYFGLPALGLTISPLTAAGTSLTIYVAAYLGEIWRGCLQSVPRAQWEAAEGSGAEPFAENDEGHPASGGAHRDASDRRVHGANHQEHVARLRRRFRRTRALRTDHQQLAVRAVPHLLDHRRDLLRPLLSGLACQPSA